MKLQKKLRLDEVKEPDEALRSKIEIDGIDELAASIRKIGLLQPIGVRKNGDKYEIEYGHRRYIAVHQLGWEEIDAIVLEETDEETLHIERAHENLVREDLNPLDEARMVYKLVYEDGRGIEATAKLLCKKPSWIDMRCDILRWPQDIQDALEKREITWSVGRELQRVKDNEKRAAFLDAAIKHGATKRVVAQWIDDSSIDTFLQSQETMEALGENISVGMSETRMECRICGIWEDIQRLRHIWLCPECLMGIRELAREVREEIRKKQEEENKKE